MSIGSIGGGLGWGFRLLSKVRGMGIGWRDGVMGVWIFAWILIPGIGRRNENLGWHSEG